MSGPETPTYYLLIPATSVEALVTLDTRLAEDARFPQSIHVVLGSAGFCTRFRACGKFAHVRLCGLAETGCAEEGKRIFQLRTYESAGYGAHVRKVQMFNESEIGIFTRTGLTPVFFGDTLIGRRMPSLTYMLTFADVADLNAKWGVFGSIQLGRNSPTSPKFGCGDRVQYLQSLFEPVELFTNLGRCRSRMKRARQRPWPISKHPVAGPSRRRHHGCIRGAQIAAFPYWRKVLPESLCRLRLWDQTIEQLQAHSCWPC